MVWYLIGMAATDDIRAIHGSAASYSSKGSAEMAQREASLQAVAGAIRGWLPDTIDVNNEDAELRVGTGGFHGSFSPVPWVRVYSPAFSPRPTEGFYLVYLFAADGSRLYLSLNQGTSEYRANKWRPVTDPAVVRGQALKARQLFDTWSYELLDGMVPDIDLRVDGLEIGTESKRRIRNYEAANVLALVYEYDASLDDEKLSSDLRRMLTLLHRVYFEAALPDVIAGTGDAMVAAADGTGQSRVADSRVRKAIEDYSMMVVMEAYAATQSWGIEDVSRFRSYDIELTNRIDGDVVHVEVKGTASAGSSVFLTKNEVDLARSFDHTVLVIVHGIQVDRREDQIRCSGGKLRWFDPWVPDEHHLAPTQFVYSVPQEGPVADSAPSRKAK